MILKSYKKLTWTNKTCSLLIGRMGEWEDREKKVWCKYLILTVEDQEFMYWTLFQIFTGQFMGVSSFMMS